MDMLIFKLLALVALFGVGFLGGLVPLRISIAPTGQRWLTWGNAFAGGILFGVGILHLLPDACELWEAWRSGPGYPVVSLVTGLGFLLVLFLEKGLFEGRESEGLIVPGKAGSPIVLLITLSVCSIIIGAALGLEAEFTDGIALFVALFAYKGATAFALGLRLKEADLPPVRLWWLVVLFASVTPFGVLLGCAGGAGLPGDSRDFAEGLFDAMAAGTLIYIATLEIIQKSFHENQDRLAKSTFVLVGFTLMAVVAIWA